MTVSVLLYSFNMGDVEDPEIYAAQPLWDWQQSEYGQWCMTHCAETPSWNIGHDYNTYGYKCMVWGKLSDQDYTFHQLKWAGNVNFNGK
jgi:hypothetical protein